MTIEKLVHDLINDSQNLINYTFPSTEPDLADKNQNKLDIINANLATVRYLTNNYQLTDTITRDELTEIWNKNRLSLTVN